MLWQEPGCTFLKGSIFDFGYMGARITKGKCGKIDAVNQNYIFSANIQMSLIYLLITFFFPITNISKLMCELGNGVINQIYEARREELGARKPQPGDPR